LQLCAPLLTSPPLPRNRTGAVKAIAAASQKSPATVELPLSPVRERTTEAGQINETTQQRPDKKFAKPAPLES
jgi:hypothetical protein